MPSVFWRNRFLWALSFSSCKSCFSGLILLLFEIFWYTIIAIVVLGNTSFDSSTRTARIRALRLVKRAFGPWSRIHHPCYRSRKRGGRTTRRPGFLSSRHHDVLFPVKITIISSRQADQGTTQQLSYLGRSSWKQLCFVLTPRHFKNVYFSSPRRCRALVIKLDAVCSLSSVVVRPETW